MRRHQFNRDLCQKVLRVDRLVCVHLVLEAYCVKANCHFASRDLHTNQTFPLLDAYPRLLPLVCLKLQQLSRKNRASRRSAPPSKVRCRSDVINFPSACHTWTWFTPFSRTAHRTGNESQFLVLVHIHVNNVPSARLLLQRIKRLFPHQCDPLSASLQPCSQNFGPQAGLSGSIHPRAHLSTSAPRFPLVQFHLRSFGPCDTVLQLKSTALPLCKRTSLTIPSSPAKWS